MAHGEHGYWLLDGHAKVLLAQDDNSDRLSILRHKAPFGEAPPWHIHRDEDETFHILEGRLRMKRDDIVLEVGPGDTVFLPRGVPHSFRVVSPDGACFLTMTHGGFERMVRAAGRPAAHDGLPDPGTPTAAELERFAAICSAHGIDLIGPPIA